MESTLSYLMRRLLWVPPVLFVVTFATFALARLGPGDPVRIAAGQFRDPEAFERVRAARGLDKPIYEQYYIYMKGIITEGDFGESFRYRDISVNEILFPAMWRSMQYNIVALILMLAAGIPLGIYAARKQGKWQDPAAISTLPLLPIDPEPGDAAVPGAVLLAEARHLAGARLAPTARLQRPYRHPADRATSASAS